MPYCANSSTRLGCTTTGSGLAKKETETTPPKNIPKTKTRFHTSLRQLYLKKGIFAGKQDAHICLKEELIPIVLLPLFYYAGTVNPIIGPATYHGQGCLMNSNIRNKKNYLCVLIIETNSFAGTTPDWRHNGFPFLNKISVGTPLT